VALPGDPRSTSDTEVSLEPVVSTAQTAVGLEPITDPVQPSSVGPDPGSTNDQTAVALAPVLTGPRAQAGRIAPRALYLKWGPLGAGLAIFVLGVGLYLLDASNDAAEATEGAVDLVVSSTPVGGTVLIDGRPLSGRTPVTVRDLPLDRPIGVSVELLGHRRWTQLVKLTPDNPNTLNAVLQPEQP